MSLWGPNDYARENRKTRPTGRKRVKQPTQNKTRKIKCSQCNFDAVVFTHGRWLCQGHLNQWKARNDKHVPVFTKASNLDKVA